MKRFISRVLLLSMFVCGSAVAQTDTAPLLSFADFTTPVGGNSHLTRTDDMVLATLEVEGLVPGDAVTLWWVVDEGFGGLAIGNATGNVVKSDGTLEFGAVLREGANEPGHQIVDHPLGPGAPLLTDAQTAVVILVVQIHGQARGGKKLREQVSQLDANCTPSCADVQVALHFP